MTLLESKEELCRKLNISWEDIRAGTDDLFNWNDIESWINLAILEVWDYASWIFKEKAYTVTGGTVADQEYYDYPEDFIADSIFLLRVEDSAGDMKTYKKIRYLDYIKYREEDETGEEKLWADHNRYYFINPEAWDTASRDIEIWGLMRADELTASTSLLPFSTNTDAEENSGNHAIVKLAYSIALASEKKRDYNKATGVRTEAYQTIELLAKRERESQADYEVYERPFFEYKKLF